MSLYNADGKVNVTLVDGTSYTGLYAANGSINIVLDDSSHFGVMHPCGAYRINSSDGLTYYDPSGAIYRNRLFGPGIDTSDLMDPPVNTVPPAVTGTEMEEETLSSTTGTWTGDGSISYSYQWYQAVLDGSDNVVTDMSGDPLLDNPIVGATSSTYDLTANDVDERIFCLVTATNGGGSVSEFSNVTGLIAPISSEDSATTAWVNAVVGDGGTVSAGRRTLVDELIVGLKADGVFSKLDRLWLFAGENSQSALRDIIAAAAATATSSPTFTADRGYTGNGSSSFIDSGFNPTTAPTPKFVLDSACLFAWSNTNAQSTGAIAGQNNNNETTIYPQYVDSNTYSAINNGSNASFGTVSPIGFFSIDRGGSPTAELYKNGALVSSQAHVSIAVQNANFNFCKTGTAFSTQQCSAGGFGQHLNSTEQDALYDRLRTYMTAVGVS